MSLNFFFLFGYQFHIKYEGDHSPCKVVILYEFLGGGDDDDLK